MDVKITVVRKNEYSDLKEKYENPLEHACDLNLGDIFISHNGEKPEGLCESAWTSMKDFVTELANGGGNFYNGWMKNPNSAMISCNDGFRPVSFLLEAIKEDEQVEEKTLEQIEEERIEEERRKEQELLERQRRYEELKEEERRNEEKQKRFLGFKKAYNRAGLNFLVFFGVLQVVCSVFMYIGMALSIILSGGGIEGIIEMLTGGAKSEYSYLIGVFYIIGYIITIVVTIIINKKIIYTKEEIVETNIKKLSITEILMMLLVSFGLWGIGVLIGNFPELICGESTDETIELIFGGNYLLYFVMAVFGAPFIEEVVCRKFFIDKTAKYGESIAVLTSALFFGLMHANTGQFFLAFLLGLVMGVVYVKTRNILYTMLIHFAINFWGSITILTTIIYDGNQAMIDFCDNIWNYATIALIVAGVVGFFIFVLVKKNPLFIPLSNNEFQGKQVFNTVGMKLFFILGIVFTGISDASSLLSYAMDDEGIKALLQLLVEGIFVVSIVLVRKYIKNNMYSKITYDENQNCEQSC